MKDSRTSDRSLPRVNKKYSVNKKCSNTLAREPVINYVTLNADEGTKFEEAREDPL